MDAHKTPDAVREAVQKGLEFVAVTLAFLGRDRGTDRESKTLDGLAIEARALDPIMREALAALDSRAGDAGEGKASNRVIYLLQGDNSRMAGALRACRDQFSFYASEHTAAGKSEKAATNARFAKIADDALTAVKPTTPAPAVDAVPAGEVLKQQAHEWRRGEVQAIGAAISTRSWHAVEQAYNALRDKMDTAGCWHASAALSHGEADRG